MSKRNTVYVELSNELQEKKLYLMNKGYNLSAHIRNLVRNLYDLEKNKEVA